jgi:hypothetical protein
MVGLHTPFPNPLLLSLPPPPSQGGVERAAHAGGSARAGAHSHGARAVVQGAASKPTKGTLRHMHAELVHTEKDY